MSQKIDGVHISTALPEEQIKQNILDARQFFIEPISNCEAWREGRPIAVVGGGPSLSTYVATLNQYPLILACGSVHDYLVSQGVVADYCLICDPDPVMAKYLTKWTHHTSYLIASQCDKAVFKQLEKARRYIWHSAGAPEYNKEMFPDRQNIVSGGCTVGTRGIVTAIGMGFKNIHLFGFDTCVQGDKHHAYDFATDQETIGNITDISLDTPGNRTFQVAGYMLAQLFDFQKLLEVYAGQVRFKVFGDGPIAEILRLGEEKAKEKLEKGN